MFCEEGDEDIEDDGCALVAVAFVFKEPSGCVIAANTSGVFNRQGDSAQDVHAMFHHPVFLLSDFLERILLVLRSKGYRG